MENVAPDAFRRPSYKAVVERLSRAINGCCIDPPTAALQRVHDATNDAPIIDPRLATRVGRQKRPKPRPVAAPVATRVRARAVSSCRLCDEMLSLG